MSLKFNTFRSARYLRTRFLEGRFLLASESTDLELEMLDSNRQVIRDSIGNIAIENSWRVGKYEIKAEVTNVAGTTLTLDTTVLSLAIIGDEVYKSGTRVDTISNIDTANNTITMPSIGSVTIGDTITIRVRNTLLLESGEAWFDGILFSMQGGHDSRVSGSNLAMGVTVPIGGGVANITAQDEPTGLGKLITFNSGGTTPAGQYRIVISAQEEVITDQEDPFLKNANIPESTGQKMRLLYRINVVPEAAQDQSPVPYTDSFSDGNLTNSIVITPVAGGEGSETSRVTITGAEQIDGRNLEVNFKNTTGSNKFPLGATQQQEFSNGTIIDSVGNSYHINLITNATVSNEVTVRIDKFPGQPEPQFIDGVPYIIKKRDIFVTDDVNGNPQGQIFYPVATVNLESTTGFSHNSNIIDRRGRVLSSKDFEEITNIKFDLKLVDGGVISWEVIDTDILDWDANFAIINAHGAEQSIAANQVALIDGASVVYFMDLVAGGPIALGNKSITVTAGTTTLSTSGNPDLSDVKKGNIIKIGSETRYITDINDISKTVTVDTAVSTTGAATIYLDTFAQGQAPINEDIFVLATRRGNKVNFANLELSSGESSNIGSSIPQALLNYVGTPSENTANPDYATAQVTEITFDDPTTISDSQYFLINSALDATRYYVWFNKSGGAVDPAPGLPITTGVEVDISTAVTADDVAEAVRTALDSLADFSAVRTSAKVTVTNTNTGSATAASNINVGGNVIIDFTFGTPAFITQGISLTGALVEVDKTMSDFNSVLDQPIYDEILRFPTGLTALTNVILPNNSRNLGSTQFYVPNSGALEVFVNGRYTLQDEEWSSVDATTIRFADDLPNDTTVHLRLDSLGGSTASLVITGGGDSWGDPVNTNIIPDVNNTRDLGSPTIKFRDGYFAGKLTVDGVVDPTGLELVPQATNPLATGQRGIWIQDTTEDLIHQKNGSQNNITQQITNIESGDSINALTRVMNNVSGVTIPQFSPVYSPSAGLIALANGNTPSTAKVIGITLESIATGSSGRIAYSGMIESVPGFSHGDRIFLDQVTGQLTATAPTVPTFPSGFTVVHIGVYEGTNLMLQIYREGVL